MKKMLLHVCCGPCSIYPVKYLRDQEFDLYGYFYNPNIHPYTEFRQRLETLEDYAKDINLQLTIEREYQLEKYLRGVVFKETDRCGICYQMRLEQAAIRAKEEKMDYFTTTLLVSPYQRHDTIRDIGTSLGEKYGVPFYYADFREGYKEATAISRELGMYRQKYCGCIFSERDRYSRKK